MTYAYAFSDEPLPSSGKGIVRVFDEIDNASRKAEQYLSQYQISSRGPGQHDTLQQRADRLKLALSRVAMHLDGPSRVGLIAQIDRLLDEESWEEEDLAPSEASFATFLQMLLTLRPGRRPGLGASGDGSITAAWTNGNNRITITCYPGGRFRWSLSKGEGDQIERGAGDTPIKRLALVLAPYNPDSTWFQNADKIPG